MRGLLFFLFLFCFQVAIFAQEKIEYDYEVDAYYSNVSAFIDLDSGREITDGKNYEESDIYKELFYNSLSPNVFLLEASIHPMSLAGLYIRHNNEVEYDRMNIYNINLIRAVTAGFEEPYSFSIFLGRMMIFSKQDGERLGKNRAYAGYLITVGDYSIKDNVAYRDNWSNIEFKLKGTREKEDRDLDWSFRVGGRFHENNNFANTVFIAARRTSIDYKKSAWSLLYNSAFSAMIALNAKTYELTEAELMVEKKWPIGTHKMSFGLGVGYLYNGQNKYNGELKDEGINNHQLLLRPNLKW